jgi:hypothetical protein
MLAVAKTTSKSFYADYYLAIVTILPILMLATNVLANFASHVSSETQRSWPSLFYLLVSFFYLYTPPIAAVGTGVGVWALMFQDTNAAYQWITFACFISVLAFLAIAAPVYLLASDPTKGARKVFQRRVKKDTGKGGQQEQPQPGDPGRAAQETPSGNQSQGTTTLGPAT